MKRNTPWFSLCIPLFLALAAPAQGQEAHSAVAEYEGEGGWSLGYALGYDTRAEAGAKALQLCNKNYVGNCIVAYRFSGSGCIAVAEGPDSLGYSVGGDRSQMEIMKKQALSECQKDGENCRIVDSDCVGSGEVAESNFVEKDSQKTGGSNTASAQQGGAIYSASVEWAHHYSFSIGSYALGFKTPEDAIASAFNACEKELRRQGGSYHCYRPILYIGHGCLAQVGLRSINAQVYTFGKKEYRDDYPIIEIVDGIDGIHKGEYRPRRLLESRAVVEKKALDFCNGTSEVEDYDATCHILHSDCTGNEEIVRTAVQKRK